MQTLQRVSASLGSSSRPITPSAASGSGITHNPLGLDVLLRTQSAWSETSSHGPSASAAADVLGVESRHSSDARMSGTGGDGGAGRSTAVGSRMLTRPELALCLLSEIAYEHDEEFRQHLPTLLHVSRRELVPAVVGHTARLLLLCACMLAKMSPHFSALQVATLNSDSSDPVVRQESSQLLVFLLYSLACKHLEAQAGGAATHEYARISGLIARLQALHGQPLWRREQPTLALPLVASSVTVAGFVQAGKDSLGV